MSEQIYQPTRDYWIAMRVSDVAAINVFGPFVLANATRLQCAWRDAYDAKVQITAPFQAKDKNKANRDAVNHLNLD